MALAGKWEWRWLIASVGLKNFDEHSSQMKTQICPRFILRLDVIWCCSLIWLFMSWGWKCDSQRLQTTASFSIFGSGRLYPRMYLCFFFLLFWIYDCPAQRVVNWFFCCWNLSLFSFTSTFHLVFPWVCLRVFRLPVQQGCGLGCVVLSGVGGRLNLTSSFYEFSRVFIKDWNLWGKFASLMLGEFDSKSCGNH